MIDKLESLFVAPQASLSDCLRYMDKIDRKLLLVGDKNNVLGLLSIGDIQREIIKTGTLNRKIIEILRKNVKIGTTGESFEHIKEKMIRQRMEYYPIVDEENRLINCYFWDDLFPSATEQVGRFSTGVVIMAGGVGSRMRPLTYVIPKPLIPIGKRSLIEQIMMNFDRHGTQKYLVSTNYLDEVLRFHLGSCDFADQISYFKESKPLGTIGSITLMRDALPETFFVTNCDIIIEEDYSKILSFHQENKFDITLVCAVKEYHIPYGTVEIGRKGTVKSLQEKPNLSFFINSGMYVMNKNCLDEIPNNEFYNITDLINSISAKGGKIGSFPVSSRSWIDIGNWQEYIENLGVKD